MTQMKLTKPAMAFVAALIIAIPLTAGAIVWAV